MDKSKIGLQNQKQRACPNCDADKTELVIRLTAAEIAAGNWSYRHDYSSLLNIDAEQAYDIVRCSICDFVFAKTLPDSSFLDILYDQVINLNTERARNNYSGDFARRLSYLSILARFYNDQVEALKVLDYGAGFGQTSRLLASQDMTVTAYETSTLRRKDLAKLSIQVAASHMNIKEQGPFSVLICDNVLEHVPDPKQTLAFFKSISEPDGLLFISVPSCEPTELEQLVSSQARSLNPWEHLNYFNIRHLDAMAKAQGWIPLSAHEIKSNIDIGLRSEPRFNARFKNACASSLRLLKFVFNAKPIESVNCRFYRLIAD